MKTKFIFLISLMASLFLILPSQAHAHCPLCTLAVGAAAVSAKYYGFDPSAIGVFVGAFGISMGLWFARKIKKQYIKFQSAAIVLASFLLTIIPLMNVVPDTMYLPMFLFGAVGSAFNKVYWINKLLFGSLLGGIASLAGFWTHVQIKKRRGKVLFPYQGIALTLALLLLVFLFDYFLMSWL